MIKHIVLLELADHINPTDILMMMNKLENLKNTSIPQIKSFSHGKSSSIEQLENGFNYCFMMEFESIPDRDYYVLHEDHKKIASEAIEPALKNGKECVIVYDF